jgi:hypothetical protein
VSTGPLQRRQPGNIKAGETPREHSRQNGIDAHSVATELAGSRLGQANDSEFAGGIRCAVWEPSQSGCARNIHYGSARFSDDGELRPHAIHDSVEVDVQRAIPVPVVL